MKITEQDVIDLATTWELARKQILMMAPGPERDRAKTFFYEMMFKTDIPTLIRGLLEQRHTSLISELKAITKQCDDLGIQQAMALTHSPEYVGKISAYNTIADACRIRCAELQNILTAINNRG